MLSESGGSVVQTPSSWRLTAAVGLASALLALGSGPLYARFGAEVFWGVMAGLCAAAMPVVRGLREKGCTAF